MFFRRVLIVLAILFVLGLIGSLSAIPSSQAMPSPGASYYTNSVTFAQIESGISTDTKLHNTSPLGIRSTQALDTSRNNVKQVCPRNDNYQLLVSRTGATTVKMLTPGACVRLQNYTTYQIIELKSH